MRLIKLLAYSLLGYVLFELYKGMTEGVAEAPAAAKPAQRRRKVKIEEGSGATATRSVGRGVVH